MKENETKALELSEEELAQVVGGLSLDGGGTANDGRCGQTVDLGADGRCDAPPNSHCNGCKYKSGNSTG